MFWWILGIVSLVLLIASIVLCDISYKFETLCIVIGFISGLCLFVAVLVIPICTISDNQEVAIFKQQKQYIENHNSKNDIEDAALTSKKIELNEWLFNAQYSKRNYRIFTFYPDEVMEFTPIK